MVAARSEVYKVVFTVRFRGEMSLMGVRATEKQWRHPLPTHTQTGPCASGIRKFLFRGCSSRLGLGSIPSIHGFGIRKGGKASRAFFLSPSPTPHPKLPPFPVETLSRSLQSCKFRDVTLKSLWMSVGYTLGISGLCCV